LIQLQGHVEVVQSRRIDPFLHQVLPLLEVHRITGGTGLGLTVVQGETRLVNRLLEVTFWTTELYCDASVSVDIPIKILTVFKLENVA